MLKVQCTQINIAFRINYVHIPYWGFLLTFLLLTHILKDVISCAEVAELADALRSGRSEDSLMRVQIPPPAPFLCVTPQAEEFLFIFQKSYNKLFFIIILWQKSKFFANRKGLSFVGHFLGEPLKGFLQELADVVVAAFFIIFFIAQSFIVDGHSMEPTLHNRERLIAEKIFYYFAGPRRGDIVVIRDPIDHTRYWVKRIIGLEGDTLEIRNGVAYLNGSKLAENYVAEPIAMPKEATYNVPKGHVFVMGDNRNNSNDSRFAGPIPVKDIMGHAILMYWPLQRTHFISRPSIFLNKK